MLSRMQMNPRHLLLQSTLVLLAAATPAPTAHANENAIQERAPVVTPSPVLRDPTKTWKRKRDILSDVTADWDSILSFLGTDVPSYVVSGIPEMFQNYPTGDDVQSSLGLDDAQVSALPTQVLNVDPYANYTDQGWNVRFHGNVYKQPNTSIDDLNSLANKFLVNVSIESLPESQQDQARNVTAEIFVLQQGNVNVSTIHLEPASSQGSSGQPGGGGAVTAPGGTQDITLPYPTTPEGDFDVFVPINSTGLMPGNATESIQRLDTMVDGTTLGNGTAYLVPDTGLTIISDIDDILRVTKIYEPSQGILNTFALPFTPWQDMPSIYANWSQSLPNMHFHYLTTTPEQITRNYMQYIYATYPGGSFDTRPLNFSNPTETLSVRKFLLDKIFETFPQRKFILVADTSNSDVMKDYPAMATDYPGQVQCIFLRNTTASDPGDRFPYDTSGFKNLNQSLYMFFVNADDLTNLDIANGQCYNQSVPQNVTFSYQGLPDGASKTTAINGSATHTSAAGASASVGISSGLLVLLGVLFWLFL